MCVTVEPALGWEGGLVEVAALVTALAGLHEHDGPLKALAVRAGEAHRGSARAAWRAAAPVLTHSAVVGPVETDAPAASVVQAQGLWGLLGT